MPAADDASRAMGLRVMERWLIVCTFFGVLYMIRLSTMLAPGPVQPEHEPLHAVGPSPRVRHSHAPGEDLDSPAPVQCGRRFKIAAGCAACGGKRECGGDCEWCSDADACVSRGGGACAKAARAKAAARAAQKAAGPAVAQRTSCGGHFAPTCGECGGQSMCNGDCQWCVEACVSKGACHPADTITVGGRVWKPPSPEQWEREPGLPVLTLTVVLPCAFENEFMERTVRSLHATTPADVLHEIIVVDDGSKPPLEPGFPNASQYKVLFLRHEESVGLIGAKHAGASAATGDVIVFLDCHVKAALG